MAEDLPYGRTIEAVERPPVLLHHQLGKEADPGPPGRKSLGHADWHVDGIADATIGLDHQRFTLPFGNHAGERGYHRGLVTGRESAIRRDAIIQWVSATATPSAASSGEGGALSRSNWATM